jgi:peptidyl-tRNA hydrolase
MANTRLTVVVRRDLQLPPGLLAAQVAHMSDAFMRLRIVAMLKSDPEIQLKDAFRENEIAWMPEPYISVLAVNCFEELNMIQEQAQSNELPVYEWEDLVPSLIFKGVSMRAKVGLSIGPADFDAIKLVTGVLPLY